MELDEEFKYIKLFLRRIENKKSALIKKAREFDKIIEEREWRRKNIEEASMTRELEEIARYAGISWTEV